MFSSVYIARKRIKILLNVLTGCCRDLSAFIFRRREINILREEVGDAAIQQKESQPESKYLFISSSFKLNNPNNIP